MKITIANKEIDFNFKYSQISKLEQYTALDELEKFVTKLSNAKIILSLGAKLSIEEAEELLDQGNMDDVNNVVSAFNHEVTQYLPNLQSQAN